MHNTFFIKVLVMLQQTSAYIDGKKLYLTEMTVIDSRVLLSKAGVPQDSFNSQRDSQVSDISYAYDPETESSTVTAFGAYVLHPAIKNLVDCIPGRRNRREAWDIINSTASHADLPTFEVSKRRLLKRLTPLVQAEMRRAADRIPS